MNEEIKEILDYFRKYMTIEDCIRLSKIEDCITNLQEEIDVWNGLYNIEFDKARKYKSRNEKAIEYLREIEMFEKKFGFDGERRKRLLNILQGGDKNE